MKKIVLVAALGLMAVQWGGGPAMAESAACKAQAVEKKLAGAAMTSFMTKCEADMKAAAPAPAAKTCKIQSADKKLAGAAQTSFMKKCEIDAATACDTAAADKKLAGAAKTSFTKKCLSEAVGA